MTWFRVGGGSGISAALKNAMNAVLNKKMGTATEHAPETWPDDVNLMGMLEEKTASGSIVTFADGADDVPLKSCEVALPASLDGYSSVDVGHTGKTVFLPMDIEQGTLSGSGYNSESSSRIRTAERKSVTPSTEYKIKVNSEVQIYEVHEYTDLTGSSTHLTVNASEYTFTTKSTTNYLRILFRYSNNATIRPSAITELQVTDGTLYWETKTANLGRTIYGGTVDIVKGEGTDENGNDFTFEPVEINSRLGDNTMWSDGDMSVTYRASGTITPVVSTLISKTITANGTYSAEDDDADGYDEVTVNVPSGTPFKYESVESSGLPSVFIAMEEGDYLCVLYCSYDGTRTFSTTGTLIFEEDINVSGDSRGIKVALCHLLPNQQISYQATTVSLYNSRLQAIIKLDDSIDVSQMVDSYAINDGNTSGYTPSYSGNVLSVAVCGGNNTEHFYDKTIPSDSAIENSVYGGLNSILHIGFGACPNFDMYGCYGNGVYIGLFQ